MNEVNGEKESDLYRRDTKNEERFKRDQIERESAGSISEEYAAEIATPPAPAVNRPVAAQDEPAERAAGGGNGRAVGTDAFRWLGYTALLLSVLSLFVFPALFGSTAALFGFFAYLLGYRALGAWSVIIGLISLAGYFLLVPLYA